MSDNEVLNMVAKIRRAASNPLEVDNDVSPSVAVWTLGRIFEMADYTYSRLTTDDPEAV